MLYWAGKTGSWLSHRSVSPRKSSPRIALSGDPQETKHHPLVGTPKLLSIAEHGRVMWHRSPVEELLMQQQVAEYTAQEQEEAVEAGRVGDGSPYLGAPRSPDLKLPGP